MRSVDPQVFSIPAPPSASFWPLLLLPIALTVILSGVLLVLVGQKLSCEVGEDGLRLRGPMYGRVIPWSSIDVSTVEVVDLRDHAEYRPRIRTNGIGFPGYKVGWFRLVNRQKALLFLTEQERVVRIPTRDGFDVFVSVEDPDALLVALTARRAA
jgi:hypothetical protein